MSEERKWEEMTALERTLRSYLYHPTERKDRLSAALPGHVRRKDYRQAADCQDAIREAGNEIEQWQQLIDLYLVEVAAARTNPVEPVKEPEAARTGTVDAENVTQ